MLAAVAGAAPCSASAGDVLTTTGDVLQYGLPLAAAACAAHQHRLASYAAGFVALTGVTQGLKHGLGDVPINERPNGGLSRLPVWPHGRRRLRRD